MTKSRLLARVARETSCIVDRREPLSARGNAGLHRVSQATPHTVELLSYLPYLTTLTTTSAEMSNHKGECTYIISQDCPSSHSTRIVLGSANLAV